jgi:lipopolysaccharide export LptBFGC system permease protein LptF
MARACRDDDHAIAKVLLLSAAVALLAAVAMIGIPFSLSRGRSHPLWLGVTLLPQALALTLPAALLVAIPAALHRHAPSGRLIRRILLLSLLYAAATFAVIGWVVPESNQAFRVASSGIRDVPRGLAELSLNQMHAEIDRLKTFHGGGRIVREIEFEYEIRLALSAAAMPLALLALALALTRAGRRRPYVMSAVSVGAYIAILVVFERVVVRRLLFGTIDVGTIAWIPNATLVLLAGCIAAVACRRERAESWA